MKYRITASVLSAALTCMPALAESECTNNLNKYVVSLKAATVAARGCQGEWSVYGEAREHCEAAGKAPTDEVLRCMDYFLTLAEETEEEAPLEGFYLLAESLGSYQDAVEAAQAVMEQAKE